jgi:hypothetical protein
LATFTVNNDCVLTTSKVLLSVVASSQALITNGVPYLVPTSVANGSFAINVYNIGSNAFSGTLTFMFIIV